VEEEERAAGENARRTTDTKRVALTRSGAPTRRSGDCGRANIGVPPSGGRTGQSEGGRLLSGGG
jgi:hypothetical protein